MENLTQVGNRECPDPESAESEPSDCLAIRVYETGPGEFVVSQNQVWVPGIYADENAARFACRFSDRALQQLQDGSRGLPIRFSDLRAIFAGSDTD